MGPLTRTNMDRSVSADWRTLAKAVISEGDPENIAKLVDQLCKALDAEKPAKGGKGADDLGE